MTSYQSKNTNMDSVEALLLRITSFNHAWKIAQDRWGTKNPISQILRDRKTRHQLFLLRQHSSLVILKPHEVEDSEPLYSLTFKIPVSLPNGSVRTDADHIPVRVINEFLTLDELNTLTH